MLSVKYKLTSFSYFLEQLAEAFGTTVIDNILSLPDHIGSGFFKRIVLENGPEALIYNFNLKEDLILTQEKIPQDLYLLAYDELGKSTGATLSIDSETIVDAEGRRTAVYLTSLLYQLEYQLNKDVDICGVRVLLDTDWMQKFLQLDQKESVIENYIKLKTLGVWYMPVDAELKQLLQDILSKKDIPLLFYQNKLLRIIEKFFSWLYTEMQIDNKPVPLSKSDIESAQKVEGIITNDITIPPPTIKELAKQVAMSESKLKKIFKTVYNQPPYEYYQKHRMQKAKSMLLSGDYSIKDVGYTLGYSNLSNFTLAFKKEFGELPSDVIKRAGNRLM